MCDLRCCTSTRRHAWDTCARRVQARDHLRKHTSWTSYATGFQPPHDEVFFAQLTLLSLSQRLKSTMGQGASSVSNGEAIVTGLPPLPLGLLRGSPKDLDALKMAHNQLRFLAEHEKDIKVLFETVDELENRAVKMAGCKIADKVFNHVVLQAGQAAVPFSVTGIIWAHVECGKKAAAGDAAGAVDTAVRMVGTIPGMVAGGAGGAAVAGCFGATVGALAGPAGAFVVGAITAYMYSKTVGSILHTFNRADNKYAMQISNGTGMYLRLQNLEKWATKHDPKLGHKMSAGCGIYGGPSAADGLPTINDDINDPSHYDGARYYGGKLVLPPATGGVDDNGELAALGNWQVLLHNKATHFCNIMRFQGYSTLEDMKNDKVAHSYTVAIIGREFIQDPISKTALALKGADFQKHYASIWQGDGDTSLDFREAYDLMAHQSEEGKEHGCTLDTGSSCYWHSWNHCVVEMK